MVRWRALPAIRGRQGRWPGRCGAQKREDSPGNESSAAEGKYSCPVSTASTSGHCWSWKTLHSKAAGSTFPAVNSDSEKTNMCGRVSSPVRPGIPELRVRRTALESRPHMKSHHAISSGNSSRLLINEWTLKVWKASFGVTPESMAMKATIARSAVSASASASPT